jgi:hypothetical protein
MFALNERRIQLAGPQQPTIWNIPYRIPPADVIQEFAKVIPQAVLLNLPGMSVEVPNASLFQHFIKEALPQFDPLPEPRHLNEARS